MASPDLKYGIETPQDWGGLERAVSVRGWCFDLGGGEFKGIRIRVGEVVFKAKRKQTRFGVAQMFPGVEAAVKSGFSAELKLPRGKSEVVFEARTSDGEWHVFDRVAAKVSWFGRGKKKEGDPYQEWIARQPVPELQAFDYEPLISIILPTYDPPEDLLRACLDSVLAQIYTNWELCIADDASPAPHVKKVLESYAAKDSRIKVTYRENNGHISAASNTALETATGEFVALLDHDDELSSDALYHVVDALQENRDAVLLYSDEDKIDASGKRCDPTFKSGWNPDLLLGQNYISHLGVYRRDVVSFRDEYVGAQDWDLVLRVTANCRPDQIVHIPKVIYHWRLTPGSTSQGIGEKGYAARAGALAMEDYLGDRATVGFAGNGHFAILYPLPDPVPSVEIIIPTRDHLEVLRPCLESVFGKTEYPNFKVTIVDNGTTDPETLTFLQKSEAKVIRDDDPFNFSRLNNVAAQASDADILVLLNNDTEVIDPNWLTELVSHAARPEIGAVGAKLLYSDGTIQHAGVFLGYGGAAGHLFKGLPADHPGMVDLVRGVSAVTAACLAVAREKYLAVGGMDEDVFGVAYNDVDLCLKLSAAGYRTLYTPFARLYHHESKSRGDAERSPEQKARANTEITALQERWGEQLRRDPFYNPNLTLNAEDGSFA